MSDRVLVVGGAGYIGSCCAKMLAEAGREPVVFDNLSTGWREFVRYGPFVHGDIRDAAGLDSVFKQYRPKSVLHFAAKSLVGESVKKPLLYWDNNVRGSLELLSACQRHAVETLVFSSTAAVYGDPKEVPIALDAPKIPVNPYGASKAAVERAIADLVASQDGLSATIFRYFNAAGAHPDADVGERHEPETHLIPNALKAAHRGTQMFLFGDDYPTRDGTCVRDYIHVVDLARAHIAAIDTPAASQTVRHYNLGTGDGFSVKEVLETCGEVTGKTIDVKVESRRPGDPPSLVAGDLEKAKAELNFVPNCSSVQQVVEDAWRWQKVLEER